MGAGAGVGWGGVPLIMIIVSGVYTGIAFCGKCL